jgi:lysophospholipase L1-like esterase
MKFVSVVIMIAAALLVATTSRAADRVEYYLSLGDSYAQGYQPIGGSPFGDGFNQGYADQLLKLVREPSAHLRLVKLGCGGETTRTMIFGGSPFCGYAGPQLAKATAFLRAHRGEVAFVTIDIGGNDVIAPDGGGVEAIQANLPVILNELRDAAGPAVPIVGMSYFNPFFVEWFTNPTSLQSHIDGIVGFNDVLRGDYGAAGDPVADIEGAFSSTDTTLQPDGVPLGVERICQWTWICLFGDHHPNTTGYAVIAHAFADALAP